MFSCNIESAENMNNSCDSCPKYHVNEDNFEKNFESSTDTDESDSSNSGNHFIKYDQWMTINGKASKVMVSLPFSDVLETAKEKINKFKYHPFVRNKQYRIYNNLKLQITGNTIFLYVDNVENYKNKEQGECQSAYFGQTSLSVFTAAAYIRLNGKTEKINIVSVSEAKDHSWIAFLSFILKAIETIYIRYPHLDQFVSLGIHLWSDGCSVQFRSWFVFQLTKLFPNQIIVIRYYN